MKRQYKAAVSDLRKKLATLKEDQTYNSGDRDRDLAEVYESTEALMKSVTRLLTFHQVVLREEKNKPGR